MRNRPVTLIAIAITLFIFFSYVLLPSRDSSSSPYSKQPPAQSQPKAEAKYHPSKDAIQQSSVAAPAAPATGAVSKSLLHGEAIMPHLGNETIKAELGRASWKLLHTTLARFPEKPTPDEREALNSYLHLFARLYPCGECATHFRAMLGKYPPQTSSRDAASQWGCFVHNVVNERLGHEVFDCGKVTDHYKCGCEGAEEEDAAAREKAEEEDKEKNKDAGKVGKKVVEEKKKKMEGETKTLEENIQGQSVVMEKEP